MLKNVYYEFIFLTKKMQNKIYKIKSIKKLIKYKHKEIIYFII